VIARAMMASSRGDTIQPLRWLMALPGDDNAIWGTMPCYMPEPECFGIKVISVFPNNFGTDYPSHQGIVLLFERQYGSPQAILDAAAITGIRTAAASAVATRVLSRSTSSKLAILGYGEQARAHLASMRMVRQIEQAFVWGRSAERANAFASEQGKIYGLKITVVDSVEAAVKEADIVCTTTAAGSPILKGAWISPGTHLNVVGYSGPTHREIDSEAIVRSRLYVDYKPMTLEAGGDYLAAVKEGVVDETHIIGEIGDVLLERCPGRQNEDDITLYKSLGTPVQDVASAAYVYQKAELADVGCVVSF
jgi:ornithine cyclodeaminase